MVAPLIIAAGITAASALAGSAAKSRREKRKRKQEAQLAKAEAIGESGKSQSTAIGNIINNLRAALIR